MIFLGNAASYHLATWRQIYALCGVTPEGLWSIHDLPGTFTSEQRVSAPAKAMAYATLGYRLRELPRDILLHAHGASGYGLAGLLSGRRYIATIYGSEILRPHGVAYRCMMRAVVRGAAAITVTSAAAQARISEIDASAAAKTHLFHTGIDTTEAAKIEAETRLPDDDMLRILLLRNAAPHYRTREALVAIAQVIGTRTDIEVIVPFGNGNKFYMDNVKASFPDPRFRFVEHPLNHHDYLHLVATSAVCVNFPVSDQVSTTLIEALYFDRAVVTNALASYTDLLSVAERTGQWFISDGDDLASALAKAIDCHEARVSDCAPSPRKGRRLVIEHFSIESAARAFRPVLEQLL
jgi:hypothetical protein